MSDSQDTCSGHTLTLIEVLLIAGIVLVLCSIVYVSFFSRSEFKAVRDSRRRQDIGIIYESFWRYALDHSGVFQPQDTPADCTISAHAKYLCSLSIGYEECLNLGCVYTAHLRDHLAAIPTDPLEDDATSDPTQSYSEYSIGLNATGQLEVSAPLAENRTISVDADTIR